MCGMNALLASSAFICLLPVAGGSTTCPTLRLASCTTQTTPDWCGVVASALSVSCACHKQIASFTSRRAYSPTPVPYNAFSQICCKQYPFMCCMAIGSHNLGELMDNLYIVKMCRCWAIFLRQAVQVYLHSDLNSTTAGLAYLGIGLLIIIIIIIIISTFINSARVTQCHNGAGWRQRLSSAHQICLQVSLLCAWTTTQMPR